MFTYTKLFPFQQAGFPGQLHLLEVSRLKGGDLIEGLEHKGPSECYIIESVSMF